MKTLLAAGALAVATLGLAGVATASALSDAQTRYRQDRAACMSGASNQDRATCLHEAGAALAEAGHGRLATAGDKDLAANRLARCAGLPVQEREECAARMQSDATSSGTAQQGGILRQHTTPAATR